jgi:hypothetical protein
MDLTNISPRQKKPVPQNFSQTMTKQSPPPAIQHTPTTQTGTQRPQPQNPQKSVISPPVAPTRLNYGASQPQPHHPVSKHEMFMNDLSNQPDDEDKIAAEENLLNEHLACVKEEAQLITQEGELITKIERQMVNEAQYDMKGYLNMAEIIAKKKLEMYSLLLKDIAEFRARFGDEI